MQSLVVSSIKTTVVTGTAVFAGLSRYHKVIIGTRSVMGDGG